MYSRLTKVSKTLFEKCVVVINKCRVVVYNLSVCHFTRVMPNFYLLLRHVPPLDTTSI